MSQKYKIIGISGSLRKGSYNKLLLELASTYLPEDFEFIYVDYRDVPLYDDDLPELPESVVKVKALFSEADGFLFATPIYNHSITGVLKNLIDWTSKGSNPISGKSAAILGGTTGVLGTENAQEHLRVILNYMNMIVLPQPRVMVSGIHKLVNDKGELVLDSRGEEFLKNLVDAFADWVRLHATKK